MAQVPEVASLGSAPTPTQQQPHLALDRVDVATLIDFFLLLKEWDSLASPTDADERSSDERVDQ